MLDFPSGMLYADNKNVIESIDLDNYEEFLEECKYFFEQENYNKITILIYEDSVRHYELTREEYEIIKEEI